MEITPFCKLVEPADMTLIAKCDKPFKDRHRATVRMSGKLQLYVRIFGTNFLRVRAMVKKYTKRTLWRISEGIPRK